MNRATQITAEIDFDVDKKNEELCKDCSQRFKCWTSKVLILSAIQFDMMSDVNGLERFSLTAYTPACFTCGNMVGSDIKICAGIDKHFDGTITKQNISAVDKRDMQIRLEGVRHGNY